jgi:hypothetical protein
VNLKKPSTNQDRRPRRWLWSSACAAAFAGIGACDAPPAVEPPLRPLLYTEVASRGEGTLEGMDEWTDPAVDPVAWPTESATQSATAYSVAIDELPETPEAAMLAFLDALLSQRSERLRELRFDTEHYRVAAHASSSAAARDVEEMDQGIAELMAAFEPGPLSQARRGGLVELLEPGQLTVGRGRNINGSATRATEEPVMHWGNELSILLRNTNVEFVLRFPRLLVDADGIWRPAGVPTIDSRFHAWRGLGMDLKPEMLSDEHAAFPLSVGNYWHYRYQGAAEAAPGATDGRRAAADGYRDEVTEIEDHNAYRVVRFRRLFDDPNRPSQTFSWLMTPKRLYLCSRECQRNASNTQWIITYAGSQIPMFVFPLNDASGWGVGGFDSEDNVWRTGQERADVNVPAGNFATAFELMRSVAGGRQLLYFVPGIGVVLRRNNVGLRTEDEELIDYRIMQ